MGFYREGVRSGRTKADYKRPPRLITARLEALASATLNSSEIHVWLRVVSALRGAFEVLFAGDLLVADVAEVFAALIATNAVGSPFFLVDLTASWAQDTLLDVDSRVSSEAQELLDHLGCDFLRKERPVFVRALRLFFEVLLALGWLPARPAHVVKADCALDMRAATLDL